MLFTLPPLDSIFPYFPPSREMYHPHHLPCYRDDDDMIFRRHLCHIRCVKRVCHRCIRGMACSMRRGIEVCTGQIHLNFELVSLGREGGEGCLLIAIKTLDRQVRDS